MIATVSDLLTRHRRLVLALLVIAQIALMVDLAARVDWTADERTWILVGHSIFNGADWQVTEQRLQGPLGLLANHLFVGGNFDPLDPDPHLFRARLGMLLFPVALLLLVERFARQAYGAGAGLLAAILIAFSPTVLGNGALLANDVALATTTVLVAWLCWRWLTSPGWVHVVALGAGIGLLLATKYSSLLLAATVPIIAAIALCRGFDPRVGAPRHRPAAIALTVLHLAVAGAVALLVLHATYLFGAEPFGLERTHALASGAFRAVAVVPGGALLLAVLPEPLVAGADYQAVASRAFSGRFLDYSGGHWAYYPVALASKTALPVLLLFAASMIWRPMQRARFAGLCIGTPALLLLGYLTFANSLQGGVRYLMPVLALLMIRAGGFASSRATLGALGRVALAIACIWLAVGTLRVHPYELGSFHELVGGPAGGWRLFADINCDWSQEYRPGREALAARHADVRFLGASDGPCFGTVAAYALDLKPEDPERPGRTWHWLERFEPIDHHSAAWLVFAIAPDDFAVAAQNGDRRAARDLAFAWLQANDLAAARRALELPGDGHEAVVEVLDLLDQLEGPTDAASTIARRAIDRLTALGRADIAARYLDRAGTDSVAELFLALSRAGRESEAIVLLRAAADTRPLTHAEALLLAFAELRSARPRAALAVLDRCPLLAADDPLIQQWRTLRAQIAQAVRSLDELEGR